MTFQWRSRLLQKPSCTQFYSRRFDIQSRPDLGIKISCTIRAEEAFYFINRKQRGSRFMLYCKSRMGRRFLSTAGLTTAERAAAPGPRTVPKKHSCFTGLGSPGGELRSRQQAQQQDVSVSMSLEGPGLNKTLLWAWQVLHQGLGASRAGNGFPIAERICTQCI